MRYVFNSTKAMTRAFMSIVALCTRPLKKRSAA